MKQLFRKIKYIIQKPVVIEVEDKDEITSEVERSLWELKDAYDLPTEEVEISVSSFKNRNKKNYSVRKPK
jgi:hypothetical protein